MANNKKVIRELGASGISKNTRYSSEELAALLPKYAERILRNRESAKSRQRNRRKKMKDNAVNDQ